ncbi:MAG: hypothetical protein QXU88_01150 [Candidatus Woesearchaeota archaeon]
MAEVKTDAQEIKKGPVVTLKRKRWYQIIAPKLFNEQKLGEAFVAEPEKLIGRSVVVSMMSLTGEPQKQNINLYFRIKGVEGEKLVTELEGYKISTSALRKVARRGKNKIEESLLVTTKDGKNIRIKPILVTSGKAKGGAIAAIHKSLRSQVAIFAAKLSSEELFSQIISNNFQRTIATSMKKIYPISFSEIKWAQIVKVPLLKAEESSQQPVESQQLPVQPSQP